MALTCLFYSGMRHERLVTFIGAGEMLDQRSREMVLFQVEEYMERGDARLGSCGVDSV